MSQETVLRHDNPSPHTHTLSLYLSLRGCAGGAEVVGEKSGDFVVKIARVEVRVRKGLCALRRSFPCAGVLQVLLYLPGLVPVRFYCTVPQCYY